MGDKAFNSADDEASIQADTGVRLVSIRKINMEPNHWIDELDLEHHRKGIETSTASWRVWASSGSIPAPIKGST